MQDTIGHSQLNKFQKSPFVNIFALLSCTSIVVYFVFLRPQERENCFSPIRRYFKELKEKTQN